MSYARCRFKRGYKGDTELPELKQYWPTFIADENNAKSQLSSFFYHRNESH